MIGTALLNVVYATVLFIVTLLSSLGTVSENNLITQSMTPFKEAYMSLNLVWPMGVTLAIVSFVLVFEGSYLLYKAIRWAYTKIPFIN